MDEFGGFGDDFGSVPEPAPTRRKRSVRNMDLYAKSPMQRMEEERKEQEFRDQIAKEKQKQNHGFDDDDGFGGFDAPAPQPQMGQAGGFQLWGKPQGNMSVVIPPFVPRDQRNKRAWDAGKLKKKDADAAILAASHGEFLIREARGEKHVIAVNDQGGLFEAWIRRDPETKAFKFMSREYTDLAGIVAYLQRNPLYNKQGLPLYIDKPCKF